MIKIMIYYTIALPTAPSKNDQAGGFVPPGCWSLPSLGVQSPSSMIDRWEVNHPSKPRPVSVKEVVFDSAVSDIQDGMERELSPWKIEECDEPSDLWDLGTHLSVSISNSGAGIEALNLAIESGKGETSLLWAQLDMAQD